MPALRIVPPYYDHPAYLDADDGRHPRGAGAGCRGSRSTTCSASTASRSATPRRGDPYATHVKRTTAALVERLGWPRGRWTQTFQSLFGREGG